MLAPWLTDDQVKQAVTAVMKLATGSTALPTHWTPIMTAANQAAANFIRKRLALRGYTPAQMDSWDERYDYNRRLALCQIFREATLPEGSAVNVDSYCTAMKELLDEDLAVAVDGVIVEPGGGGSGGGPRIGFGVSNSPTDGSVTLDTEL
jgi:hypothetical protein